ncbi:hypothetical protein ABGB07_22925 [Micromonosporaceae bacterium B7E4]
MPRLFGDAVAHDITLSVRPLAERLYDIRHWRDFFLNHIESHHQVATDQKALQAGP